MSFWSDLDDADALLLVVVVLVAVLCFVSITGCSSGSKAGGMCPSAPPPIGFDVRGPTSLPTKEVGPQRMPIRGLSRAPDAFGMWYHGGPLMLGTPRIYFIWYGNWTDNTAVPLLTDFAQHFGCSDYYGINTTYYQILTGKQIQVTNGFAWGGFAIDNYSQGQTINDLGVFAIVTKAILSGTLPLDYDGLYFVLTSKDVMETSGFCSYYCGWHFFSGLNGRTVKFAFIGNPDQCPCGCETQTISPNGNAGADGMASVIAHEAEEMVSDPEGSGWYNDLFLGAENADMCAWTYGKTQTAKNGSMYNAVFGDHQYLIQQNWLNELPGGCMMALPP